MRPPRFLHLRGREQLGWCHLTSARLVDDLVRVQLAEAEPYDPQPADLNAWLEARRGAVSLPCGPDACHDRTLVGEHLERWLVDDPDGWRVLAPTIAPPPPTGWTFVADTENEKPPPILALVRDRWHRLWALVDDTVQLFEPAGLRRLDLMALPDDGPGTHLAVTDRSVIVATGWLWRRSFGGEWAPLVVESGGGDEWELDEDGRLVSHRPVATAGGLDDRIAVLFHGVDADAPSLLGICDDGHTLRLHVLDAPAHPLPLLVLPDGDILVGGVEGTPGGRTDFWRLHVEGAVLGVVEVQRVRGFDGRAVFVDSSGEPHVTTTRGPVALRRPRQATEAQGTVETFALDSKRYGCVWHRVALDLCLPRGADVRVEARTSDSLYPPALALESPRRGLDPATQPQAAVRHYGALPFGSRVDDDPDGWVALPPLRRRPAYADQAVVPADEGAAIRVDTFDGLLLTPPGRYLWLRVHLSAARFSNPALSAIRVSYPRPSMLDLLPAFWREDPVTADRTERFLSLFEGMLTELDARIDGMPAFFDPRAVPREALPWLGAFLGATFDQRIGDDVRRALLAAMPELYRRRGTVGALERMTSIVAGAEVRIVESFRMRRRSGAWLGTAPDNTASGGLGTLMGPGLQLGAGDAAGSIGEHYGMTAHRFQVLIARTSDPMMHDVIDALIEATKPAHCIHTICWVDGGFQLDRAAYVGLTRLGASGHFPSAHLDAPLGHTHLPSRYPRFGTRVGASRVGRNTHTS